jgi:hypothetical protein
MLFAYNWRAIKAYPKNRILSDAPSNCFLTKKSGLTSDIGLCLPLFGELTSLLGDQPANLALRQFVSLARRLAAPAGLFSYSRRGFLEKIWLGTLQWMKHNILWCCDLIFPRWRLAINLLSRFFSSQGEDYFHKISLETLFWIWHSQFRCMDLILFWLWNFHIEKDDEIGMTSYIFIWLLNSEKWTFAFSEDSQKFFLDI